jgi:hypothetical protein
MTHDTAVLRNLRHVQIERQNRVEVLSKTSRLRENAREQRVYESVFPTQISKLFFLIAVTEEVVRRSAQPGFFP